LSSRPGRQGLLALGRALRTGVESFFAVEVGSTPNTDEKCWSAHDLNTFTMILRSWGLVNPDSLRGLLPNGDDLIGDTTQKITTVY